MPRPKRGGSSVDQTEPEVMVEVTPPDNSDVGHQSDSVSGGVTDHASEQFDDSQVKAYDLSEVANEKSNGTGDAYSEVQEHPEEYSDAKERQAWETHCQLRNDTRDKQIQKLLDEQEKLMAKFKLHEEHLLQVKSTTEMNKGTEIDELPKQPFQVASALTGVANLPVAPLRTIKSGLSKCPRYNGETEWCAFQVQFQAWLRLNNYDGEDCRAMWCDILGLALDGEAQLFYSGLSNADRTHYETLIHKLEQRYSGIGVVEVYRARLQNISKRQPDESLEKLRDSLWLMARKAYPALPREAQEQLATDALMRAVDHDLRIQCTMKECKSLDEAVAVMQRYEAVQQVDPERRKKVIKMVEPCRSDVKPRESTPSKQLDELCSKMADILQQQMKVMENFQQFPAHKKFQRNRAPQVGSRKVGRDECFHCGQKGHFIKDCLLRDSQQACAGNTCPPTQ